MDLTWTTQVLFHNTNKKKMDCGIIRDGVGPPNINVSLLAAVKKTKPEFETNPRLPESRALSSYPPLTKKKGDEGIRAWIVSHTPSVLAGAKRSYPLPLARVCCAKQHIPQSAPNSHILSIFLQGLRTMLRSSLCPPTIFYPYPVSRPLPTTIIELETIQKDQSHTRHFSHAYFAILSLQDVKRRDIHLEERFAAVSVARVEEAIRGKRGSEKLTTEWATRDEIANERIFWRCKNCECGYWVRVMEVAETGGNWNADDSVTDDTWAIVSEVRTQDSPTELLSEFLDVGK